MVSQQISTLAATEINKMTDRKAKIDGAFSLSTEIITGSLDLLGIVPTDAEIKEGIAIFKKEIFLA